MSHSVLTLTFGSCANPRLTELPWPRMPMLATTTRSLAPRTRPCDAALRRVPEEIPADRQAGGCRAESRCEVTPRDAVLIMPVVGHVDLLLAPLDCSTWLVSRERKALEKGRSIVTRRVPRTPDPGRLLSPAPLLRRGFRRQLDRLHPSVERRAA